MPEGIAEGDNVVELRRSVSQLGQEASFDLARYAGIEGVTFILSITKIKGDFSYGNKYVELILNGEETSLVCTSTETYCGAPGAGFTCMTNVDFTSWLRNTNMTAATRISFRQGRSSDSLYCSPLSFSAAVTITVAGTSVTPAPSATRAPSPLPSASSGFSIEEPVSDAVFFTQEEIKIKWSADDVYSSGSDYNVAVYLCSGNAAYAGGDDSFSVISGIGHR